MNIKVLIVYFSGTGGTERIANSFEAELIKRDYTASRIALDYSKTDKNYQSTKEILQASDLVILIFAVHAFDAPDSVYDWIRQTDTGSKRIAVISVSGGGDVWPNTGCRNNCCKALEDRGFEVVHEKMMVMPSNWVFETNDHLAMWLIKAVPDKVNKILDSLLDGKTRRTRLKKGFMRNFLTSMEKRSAHKFAKELIIGGECSGCGWCSANCPVNNIILTGRRPAFGNECIMCFRCVYGCPHDAIKSESFMVFKKGFSLEEIEKRMEGIELEPVEKCAKGLMWSGAKNYLLDKDGY
jgi:ferredoxin